MIKLLLSPGIAGLTLFDYIPVYFLVIRHLDDCLTLIHIIRTVYGNKPCESTN